MSNPTVRLVHLAIQRHHDKEAVAYPYFGDFEIEDFVYLIGPFTWVGVFERFFLASGLGAIGYLSWQSWELLGRRR